MYLCAPFEIETMKALKMFSIPVKGLGIGKHTFDYSFSDEFFTHFEDSQIKSGLFDVKVTLDKQVRMMEFNFEIEGQFKASCDRCLEEISIPTGSIDRLLVKMGVEADDDNEEVIYIDENEKEINLAPFIYEFIHLSKPLQNIIDCEENDYEYCDLSVLDKMDGVDQEENKNEDPTWDQLKNIELG